MKEDEAFLRDLERSRRSVLRVADAMRSKGVIVSVPETITRPDASVRRQYADRGDLFATARVEVKRRGLHFTCRADFPYQTLIVDEVYKVEDKSDPLLMYAILSQSEDYAAVVYGWTRGQWERQTMHDRAQNRACEYYVIDKDRVRFCPVSEVI